MTACATPVGVQRVGTREAHRLLTTDVLSTGTLSEHSLQVLSRQNLLEQFARIPQARWRRSMLGFSLPVIPIGSTIASLL